MGGSWRESPVWVPDAGLSSGCLWESQWAGDILCSEQVPSGEGGACAGAEEVEFWWGKQLLDYCTRCPSVCLSIPGSWKTPKKAVVLRIPTPQGVLMDLVIFIEEVQGLTLPPEGNWGATRLPSLSICLPLRCTVLASGGDMF